MTNKEMKPKYICGMTKLITPFHAHQFSIVIEFLFNVLIKKMWRRRWEKQKGKTKNMWVEYDFAGNSGKRERYFNPST